MWVTGSYALFILQLRQLFILKYRKRNVVLVNKDAHQRGHNRENKRGQMKMGRAHSKEN